MGRFKFMLENSITLSGIDNALGYKKYSVVIIEKIAKRLFPRLRMLARPNV